MTKSELVKAARTMSVRMGDADKLRAQQRQAMGPAAGALESWCPPNPSVPCHLCTGTLTAHAAGCPKAPKARVPRLPAAAAPCGLVMDGDRLDAHRAQCVACQTGKQAASYMGIDAGAPWRSPPQSHPDPMFNKAESVKQMLDAGVISQDDARRALGLCCPLAYGNRGHNDWCRGGKVVKPAPAPAPAPVAKPAPPAPITCCRIGAEMALDWPGIGRRPCPFHAGKKLTPGAPPPWVPEIDDWDLLPNA